MPLKPKKNKRSFYYRLCDSDTLSILAEAASALGIEEKENKKKRRENFSSSKENISEEEEEEEEEEKLPDAAASSLLLLRSSSLSSSLCEEAIEACFVKKKGTRGKGKKNLLKEKVQSQKTQEVQSPARVTKKAAKTTVVYARVLIPLKKLSEERIKDLEELYEFRELLRRASWVLSLLSNHAPTTDASVF
jgi:hypothetical protein